MLRYCDNESRLHTITRIKYSQPVGDYLAVLHGFVLIGSTLFNICALQSPCICKQCCQKEEILWEIISVPVWIWIIFESGDCLD